MKVILLLSVATTVWSVPAHKQEQVQVDDVRLVTYVADEQGGFKAQIKNADGTVTEKDVAELSIQNAKTVEVAPVRYSVKHSPVVHYYAGWPFPGNRKKNRPQPVSKPDGESVPAPESPPITFYGSEFPDGFFGNQYQQQFQADEQGQGQGQGQAQFQQKADGSFVQVLPKINFYSDSWPSLEDSKEDADDDEADTEHKIVRKIPSVLGEWPSHVKKETTVKASEDKTSSHHFFGSGLQVSQQGKFDEKTDAPHRIVQKIPQLVPVAQHQAQKVVAPVPIVSHAASWPFTQQVSHSTYKHTPVTIPFVSYTGGWPVNSPFQHTSQVPVKSAGSGLTAAAFTGSALGTSAFAVPVVAYTGNWPQFSQVPFNHQVKQISSAGASVPLVTYGAGWPIGQHGKSTAQVPGVKEVVDFKSVIAQASTSPIAIQSSVAPKVDKFSAGSQFQWAAKESSAAGVNAPPHIPGYVAIPIW